jgi:hypothetical protein
LLLQSLSRSIGEGTANLAVTRTTAASTRPADTLTRLTTLLVRAVALVLFAGVIGALAFRIGQYLVEAWCAVNFPFSLDVVEGAVWQQATLIPGPKMYGPIDAPPFSFFEYPPGYHVVVHGLAALGGDFLKVGRALSVACALVIAGLCSFLVNRAMRSAVCLPARALGATVAAFVPLTYHPVTYWSQQMRVDMLAIALSFLGVTLTVLAARSRILLWPAMIAFVCAVYTKQTELAAPAAALAVALIIDARQAMRVALVGIGMAAVVLVVLELATGGGFLRHIVLYNSYPPFSLSAALSLVTRIYRDHVVYFAVGWTGLWFVWVRQIRSSQFKVRDFKKFSVVASFLRESDLHVVLAASSLWFALSTIMLVTAGQVGANENHVIETMCLWAIPTGMLAAFTVAWAFGRAPKVNGNMRYALASTLAVALLFQVRQLGPKQYGDLHDPAFAAASERLIQEVRRAAGPVYSEDMVVSMRSGRGVAVEPPFIQSIFLPGGWDKATAFVRMIEEGQFASLIMRYESAYSADALSKIRNSYPITEQVGPYVIRRPRL